MTEMCSSGSARSSKSVVLPDGGSDVTYKHVHCIACQRIGKKNKGEYYCRDCRIGLCTQCAYEHTDNVRMNKHSVSVICQPVQVSHNQGPFPELTEIGTIKFDVAKCIRGSTFLSNGELAVTDFTESKILLYSADYRRTLIGKLLVPRQKAWEERPKPLSITGTGDKQLAFTTNTGCVYMLKVCSSMILKVERVVPVINFDSNYGECFGIAFNSSDEKLYVSCFTDKEGSFIKVLGVDGSPCRDVTAKLTDLPTYLKIGLDKTKIYTANSDAVQVYRIQDFEKVEEYSALEAQTKDILTDKWGYLYTIAIERRLLNHPGSIYRLDTKTGVTKVTSLIYRPTSVAYCPKSDDVAVTFEESRYIFFYKLKLRTFQKPFGNDLKPYKK